MSLVLLFTQTGSLSVYRIELHIVYMSNYIHRNNDIMIICATRKLQLSNSNYEKLYPEQLELQRMCRQNHYILYLQILCKCERKM